MNGFGDGVRAPYRAFVEWLGVQHMETLRQKSAEAEVLFRRSGITFAVYGNDEAAERLIPFDILPRIIGADEWRKLEQGIEQRVRALNAFLYDIYHRQEILKAGKVPAAARSRASARACSRFIRRAISSRPPTTRRFYKSVSTSMASRSSTAWRGPTCALAKPPS